MKFRATLFVLLTCFAPAMATADYVDGFGDAIDSFGAGGPILDIDTLNINYDSANLYFDLSFHTPISAPSDGSNDSVVGFIELDTDQSDETGIFPIQNSFSPPFASLTGVGVDFLIVLDDSATPGSGFLTDANLNFLNSVALTYGPNSVSGHLPLSDIGNDDGLLNFTTTIGTIPQPTDATDIVGTSTATAIPDPAGAAVLGAIAIGRLLRRRA